MAMAPTALQPARVPEPLVLRDTSIDDIADKVYSGERLTFDDGRRLFQHNNIVELAALADYVRWKKHPEPVVTYVVARNINYTNVCWVRCSFCNFYRVPGDEGGYVLSREVIYQKIQELVEVGGVEILMQGGLNPKLKIGWYEELLSDLRDRFPTVIRHAFSPAELIYIKNISKLSMAETLTRLKNAGLSSIPGGGAEILTDRVRQHISRFKDTADEWIDCMRVAHQVGLPSTATMMYGSVDTIDDRVEHFMRLRDLQDETGGFTAFAAWNYQPDGTELGGTRAPAFDYLRTIAIARIMLDNFDNIQASWVTQGPRIGQLSLRYGVNDFGQTMMEENVVSQAGCVFAVPIEEMERLITDAGFTPLRRNTRYEIIDGRAMQAA